MTFDLLPADALVLLQLAAGGTKDIPQCNIRVRVSRVLAMGMPDHNLLAGNGNVHLEVKQSPLLMVLVMRCFHDHMAPDDLTAEALQLLRELANASLERGGGGHIAESDLELHRGISLLAARAM